MALSVFDTVFSAPPLPSSDLNPKVELYLSGSSAWLDVSSRVFYDSMTLQRGGPDESTTVTASTLSATLDNHDGVLSTLNPLSPYYGQLGLNTPIRTSVPNGSSSLLLETGTVSGCSTASSTTINSAITGTGFEIWVDADLDNWWSTQALVVKWAMTGNQRSFVFGTDGTGAAVLQMSATGSSSSIGWQSNPLPIVHGRMSVRVSYVKSTGVATFYTGPPGCTSWTQNVVVTNGSAFTPFGSTAAVQVGFISDGSEFAGLTGAQGKIYAAGILNTVGGGIANIIAAADTTTLATSTVGWADTLGNTWGLVGTASISNRNYRFYGECSAWPQSWSNGSPNARVNLQASGLLRRLGQGNTPINSPIYRAFTRASSVGQIPIAYWPCEDSAGSSQLAAATPGLAAGVISGKVQAASGTAFACSAALPVTSGGTAVFNVPKYAPGSSAGTGTIVRWLMEETAADVANAVVWRANFSGGTVSRIEFIINSSTNVTFNVYDGSGTVISNTGWTFPMQGNPFWWSIEYEWTAAGYQLYVVCLPIGAAAGSSFTLITTTAGTVGSLAKLTFNPVSTALTQNIVFGHVTVQTVWADLYLQINALAAYDGELAGVRFQRLCSEEGIPFRGMGNLKDTQPMGIQAVKTMAALLQECTDADQGIWYEPRQCLGWGYRTRQSLANQAVAVTLDYNQDHLSGRLEPTKDDQVVKNDVTLTSQNGGSSARQTLDDGSPQAIGTIGRYDTQATQNIDNQYLAVSVGWMLWFLSCGDPRYKSVSCDLANSQLASLYYAIIQLDIGDRINISNPPVWLPPGQVDQVIKGLQEVISSKGLELSWNTVPTTPYNVAFFDDLVYGRVDTDYSRLTNTITNSQTSFSVTTSTTIGTVWTVAAGDFPFNIMINGEVMTVTNITGATSPQTFTVVRGVNGVRVTALNGTYFQLAPSPIISL